MTLRYENVQEQVQSSALGAYILVGNRIHYYKDYLTDTRDEVFSN